MTNAFAILWEEGKIMVLTVKSTMPENLIIHFSRLMEFLLYTNKFVTFCSLDNNKLLLHEARKAISEVPFFFLNKRFLCSTGMFSIANLNNSIGDILDEE